MNRTRLFSIALALGVFILLSLLARMLFRGLGETYSLESRNDAETTVSVLFASLRHYDDFGAAIEALPSLKDKVVGVSLYAQGGARLYVWGSAPDAVEPPDFSEANVANGMARIYRKNPAGDSLVLLLRPSREHPEPPPPPLQGVPENRDRREHSFMFETLRDADLIYLEILQPEYWRKERLRGVLFPAVEILLAALVYAARLLILKNEEYRHRIETQKNLVVLGTAASTLAHEIKNPLLAIRLQTTILAKTLAGAGIRELAIIDSEVERLSSLSNRVGDYLRDPVGASSDLDPADIAGDVGRRLCGRDDIPGPGPGTRVHMDPERLRSVLENLLRNALESGSPPEEVGIEIDAEDGRVRIDVLDRGAGVPGDLCEKVFDPFFTTKSRGSGIGLSICRRFAEAAGGSLSLENRPGGGARARLTLPSSDETVRKGRPS